MAFSEQLYAMKPGTVKLEISPSHFVFTMNQNPVKDSGDSLLHPPPLPKRKKTPSDLRRNAFRKAEFLQRKNSIPQAKPKNPPNTDVPTPPTEDKITISNPKKILAKKFFLSQISWTHRLRMWFSNLHLL